ncbi:MAG: T9SS type A sorting domain-containing protein [Saprospiraceae bacterium]|nr:T9SS type A sorting domain-containing protein [Saprospiraceae bacterium]
MNIAISQEEVHPCGTPNYFSDWDLEYSAHPEKFTRGGDSILYIPLSLHNVGSDQGSGYLQNSRILESLCRINEDFKPANIQFFLAGNITYINNSAWNNHQEILTGADMMLKNNIKNSVNIYYNSTAAGNGGYNLPYAGISMLKTFVNATAHTLTHELGHAFSVQHTFLGWEGKVYDNNFYKTPAPQKVTYDYTLFKDSLITNKTIIDTAFVELVDGSNCAIAADKTCDTKADYLAYRWPCNSDGTSMQLQKDPNGADFRSDGTLYMTYSNDACQNRFSNDQIARMRANILNKKKDMLYNQSPPIVISTNPILIFPIDSQIVQYDNVKLNWDATPNATSYLVHLSRFKAMDILEVDTIVTANSLNVKKLIKDRVYYWRVKPFNEKYFCTNYTTQLFRTVDFTNNIDIEEIGLELYPNPISMGNDIQIINNNLKEDTNLKIYNTNGELINNQTIDGNSTMIHIPENLSTGLYLLQFNQKNKVVVKKINIVN